MIEFDKVSFRYGSKTVVDDLSFTAPDGCCTVLAGPNGIGKSTVLALAAGVLRPRSGKIRRSGSFGYAPQEAGLFGDLSVKDNLRFFARAAGTRLPDRFFLPIEDFLGKRVSKLSGGMQQKVSLVCAGLGEPACLLLDEPCAGLDLQAKELLFSQIAAWKQQGRCILYVAHDPEEIDAVCDRLVLLGENGAAVSDRESIPDLAQFLKSGI